MYDILKTGLHSMFHYSVDFDKFVDVTPHLTIPLLHATRSLAFLASSHSAQLSVLHIIIDKKPRKILT